MAAHDIADRLTTETALRAALRALPSHAPQPELWPDLARTLAARRRWRALRYALPAALAAAVALALLWPRPAPQPPGIASATSPRANIAAPASVPVAASATVTEVVRLTARSQALEGWVRVLSAQSAQNGQDLMAAAEIEDLIGLVDLQLSAARDAREALPLWRRRVALLEDLAAIRGDAYALNETGTTADLAAPASPLRLQ